jgi:hypothetical protein
VRAEIAVEPRKPLHGDGHLPAAFTRLERAVDALIEPTLRMVNDQPAEIDSLYLQLYDAVPGEQGNGHAPARSMPPLWIDASELLAQIDTAARRWKPAYTRPAVSVAHMLPPTVCRLRELLQQSWRPQDTHLMDDISARIEGWVIEIDLLLTPQHVKHVKAACPNCGHKTALRRDSAGEMVRVPVLQIIADQGCTCVVCKAHWPPGLYLHLCRVLGFDMPEGVVNE